MREESRELTFSQKAELILKSIPKGKIISYGAVAALAGSPKAARRIVQILHRVENIPWHRVVNSNGNIAIKEPAGFEEQRILLKMEGVESDQAGKIDFYRYRWNINSIDNILTLKKD